MRGSRTFTAWHLTSASLVVATALTHGGDAVAVGYNADGVWTAATYYCSSTPRGGADYKDEKGAREAALADLRHRAREGMASAKIIAASDRTGHVAYARGQTESGAELHAVGYGASKAVAEERAFADLAKHGATRKRKTIYKYFSHGSDAPPPSSREPSTR